MGFYLRKSFRAGPVRLNLSKSGFGTSIGVKGFRVGTSARGRSYVHAGRGGLYYRKSLNSGRKSVTRSGARSGINLGYLILFIIGLIVIVNIFKWMTQNPGVTVAIGIVLAFVAFSFFYSKNRKTKIYEEYKNMLDKHFVLCNNPPKASELTEIQNLRRNALKYQDILPKLNETEKNIYAALLDKIIDDQKISDEEKLSIQHLESILYLDENYIKETKKEIFRLLCLDIIADHEITDDEVKTINNYFSGLGLQKTDVKDEIKFVEEIIRMQKLSLPLQPAEDVPVKIQKSETPYYSGKGKVLTRKKAVKSSNSHYEYSVRNEGNFVVTDKRLLVVGEGSTNINLKDILDIDVDLDNSMIVVKRSTASVPTYIQTDEPLYSAKIIDLLTG